MSASNEFEPAPSGGRRHPLRANARVLTAALVGTSVEFYDFYLYVTAAALVFGPLFFPAASREAQLLSAYLSFGLAFVARPLGAIAFGHFGDRVGRKATLVASLLLMGGSTMAIAFLPTYQTIGWVAPLLLCILRFGQGFGLGGEWGGAALLAVENAPRGWTARFGAAPQLGSPIGLVAANGLFVLLGLALTDAQFLTWGWRIPFVSSAALVGIGLWIRLRISETAAFSAARDHGPPPMVPIGSLLRGHKRPLLIGVMGSVSAFAIFYLCTAFALSHATGTLGLRREAVLGAHRSGYDADREGQVGEHLRADATSPAAVIRLGGLATVVVGLGFGTGLHLGTVPTITATIAVSLFTMGFVYGPLSSWLSAQFPVEVRYTGSSVAFAIGGIIGGALTPYAAQIMTTRYGVQTVGLLMSAAGLCTYFGARLGRPA
jgi:hypothetical protein